MKIKMKHLKLSDPFIDGKQVVGVIIAIVIFAILAVSATDYTNSNTQQMQTQTEKAWDNVVE